MGKKIPLTYRSAGGAGFLIGEAEIMEDGIIHCTINMRTAEALRLVNDQNFSFSFVVPEENQEIPEQGVIENPWDWGGRFRG